MIARLVTVRAVPVPDKLTVREPPPVLMESDPVRRPEAVGVKVTLIVQELLPAIDEPHVLVWAKSPLTTMEPMVCDELRVLLAVTVWAALVTPMTVLVNVNDDGLTETFPRPPPRCA